MRDKSTRHNYAIRQNNINGSNRLSSQDMKSPVWLTQVCLEWPEIWTSAAFQEVPSIVNDSWAFMHVALRPSCSLFWTRFIYCFQRWAGASYLITGRLSYDHGSLVTKCPWAWVAGWSLSARQLFRNQVPLSLSTALRFGIMQAPSGKGNRLVLTAVSFEELIA